MRLDFRASKPFARGLHLGFQPVNVVMGLKGATYSVEELAAAGVRRISVGGAFARAAIGAFVRAAREVKDKEAFTFAVDAISHAEVRGYMANVKRCSPRDLARIGQQAVATSGDQEDQRDNSGDPPVHVLQAYRLGDSVE